MHQTISQTHFEEKVGNNFPFEDERKLLGLSYDIQTNYNTEGEVSGLSKWFATYEKHLGCLQADSTHVQGYIEVSRETAELLQDFCQNVILSEKTLSLLSKQMPSTVTISDTMLTLLVKIKNVSDMVRIDGIRIDDDECLLFWSIPYENISIEALIDKAEMYMWKLWDLLCQ